MNSELIKLKYKIDLLVKKMFRNAMTEQDLLTYKELSSKYEEYMALYDAPVKEADSPKLFNFISMFLKLEHVDFPNPIAITSNQKLIGYATVFNTPFNLIVNASIDYSTPERLSLETNSSNMRLNTVFIKKHGTLFLDSLALIESNEVENGKIYL